MSELIITFDKESPSLIDETINIKAISEGNEDLEYKFLEGIPGERNLVWKQIEDFSDNSVCKWNPKNPGEYMIMVQARDKSSGSTNSRRIKYIINDMEEKGIIEVNNKNSKLIRDVAIDKTTLTLGEKINLDVLSEDDEELLLYRFWII